MKRDFGIFKDGADSDGELAFTIGAPTQSGADFLGGIGRDAGKPGLVFALAMRTHNAVFPKHGFKVCAGFGVRVESADDLNQRKVFERRLRFRASNIA